MKKEEIRRLREEADRRYAIRRQNEIERRKEFAISAFYWTLALATFAVIGYWLWLCQDIRRLERENDAEHSIHMQVTGGRA